MKRARSWLTRVKRFSAEASACPTVSQSEIDAKAHGRNVPTNAIRRPSTMTSSDRGALKALGFTLVAIVAVAWTMGGPVKQGALGGERNPAQAQSSPSGSSVRTQSQLQKEEIEDRLEKESIQREKDDLVAQQSMAQYTEELVFWTRFQVLLAAVGTVALVYSLHLNRRATTAATDASFIAREALGAERAWMTMVGPSFGVSLNSNVSGVTHDRVLVLRVRWKNDGRTPAIKTRASMNYEITDSHDEPAIRERFLSNDGALVGPGNVVTTPPQVVDWETVMKVSNHEKFMFIYSRVQYEDTFYPGKTRMSEGVYHVEILRRVGEEHPDVILSPVGPRHNAS